MYFDITILHFKFPTWWSQWIGWLWSDSISSAQYLSPAIQHALIVFTSPKSKYFRICICVCQLFVFVFVFILQLVPLLGGGRIAAELGCLRNSWYSTEDHTHRYRRTKIQKYRRLHTPKYRNTEDHTHINTEIQKTTHTKIQKYRSTQVQKCRRLHTHKCRDTEVPKYLNTEDHTRTSAETQTQKLNYVYKHRWKKLVVL